MKIQVPNSETGQWDAVEPFENGTRKEKDGQYIEFFDKYAKRIKNIEDRITNTETSEAKNLSRSIEILAIFVTLFTFISLEAQILRSGISFFSAIGFSLIMLSGLCFFLFSLHFFTSKDVGWHFVKYFLCLIFVFIILIVGLFVIWKGENSFKQGFYDRTEIDTLLSTERGSNDLKFNNEDFKKFKKCFTNYGILWDCIRENNKDGVGSSN